jgi:hypothetical protein
LPRKKASRDFPPGVRAILRASAHFEPCPKFRKAPLVKFVEHVNEGKCEQCLAFLQQAEKDTRLIKFLMEGRN